MPDQHEPLRERRVVGGPGRIILIIAIVAVVALVIAYATGMFNVQTSGDMTAPRVSIEPGQVPDMQVNTADIVVGTETKTVEVPKVTVTPADDN